MELIRLHYADHPRPVTSSSPTIRVWLRWLEFVGVMALVIFVGNDMPLLGQQVTRDGRRSASAWSPQRPQANAFRQVAQTMQPRDAASNPFTDDPLVAKPVQRTSIRLVPLKLGPVVPLSRLVNLVSNELKLNILYDPEVLKGNVNVRAPKAVPANSLLPLLRNVLKMNGLAIQESESGDWSQIVAVEQLASIATFDRGRSVVTKIYELGYVDPAAADKAVKPFLSRPGGSSQALGAQRLLLVTDYATTIEKIDRIVRSVDRQSTEVKIEFLTLKHADAAELAGRVKELLGAKTAARGAAGQVTIGRATAEVQITPDTRTSQLIVVGSQEQIDDVARIVRSFDIAANTETKAYALTHGSAERAARVLDNLLGSKPGSSMSAAVDADSNQLLVSANPSTLRTVDSIIKSLDRERAPNQSRLRFYKLENVTAIEMLSTLRSVEGQTEDMLQRDVGGNRIRGVSGGTRSPFYPGSNRPTRPDTQPFVPGPNRPTTPGQYLPAPPAYYDNGQDVLRGQQPQTIDDSEFRLPGGNAQITADESSNSLIVVADPEVQRAYSELIKTLDRRRPQVLIEARLIMVDTSDDYTLGIEVSGGDREGAKRLFGFSSFGFSAVDAATGALSLTPGTGFNGALVDPDVADVIVRALVNHRRSRVVSAPRILVNDNALGVLTSVEEVPFSSVNASNVVATTSFAGFAEAGTTVEVTPHISADDYLQLEYRIILNSFVGTGGDGIPPGRQTNEVSSVVTIPDGHTVIVGGLNQNRQSTETSGIPFVENIPILRNIGGRDARAGSNSALFVFLRPIILRDDKFRDLKFLSGRDSRRASDHGDYPRSAPLLMR